MRKFIISLVVGMMAVAMVGGVASAKLVVPSNNGINGIVNSPAYDDEEGGPNDGHIFAGSDPALGGGLVKAMCASGQFVGPGLCD